MKKLAFVLLVSPFYLNDFASIFVSDWRLWLSIDYIGVKLFPCAVVLWLIRSKIMQPAELGLGAVRPLSFIIVFLVVMLVGSVIDQNAYQLIERLPGYAPLGGMPAITSPVWNWIDLTWVCSWWGSSKNSFFAATRTLFSVSSPNGCR